MICGGGRDDIYSGCELTGGEELVDSMQLVDELSMIYTTCLMGWGKYLPERVVGWSSD